MLWRGFRQPRYFHGLDERLGFPPLTLDATIPGGIWLHAVSVGEILTAVELIKFLKASLPGRPIFVTVTTLAGRELAEDRLRGIADVIFYAPLDYAGIVRHVLRRLRPRIVVIMETEIWPNLFRETKRFGCGLIIVNGRISDRAFPKYLRWRWFFEAVLAHPDRVLVQNEIARERYQALGVPSDRLAVTGNLKYDFAAKSVATPALVRDLIAAAKPNTVWIAASTMPPAEPGDPDEDDVVIAEYQKLIATHPRTLLILVPRRPERFEDAALKLTRAGLRFTRRSAISASIELPGVLLLDSMGELSSLFPLADVVFMGGTLAHRGGHNILEPAFFAKPVIIGPHMENFPDIAQEFRAGQAVAEIGQPGELAAAVARLLQNPNEAAAIGKRAHALAESKRGVTAKAAAEVLAVYSQAVPSAPHSILNRAILGPLQYLWLAGLNHDRSRKQQRRGRLKAKVISVGGIAMGGVGKTPVVAWLAQRLDAKGIRVAVLTRGYKRQSPEKSVIAAPGDRCSVSRTGDEAQLLLRRGHAVIGVGADRKTTGEELERLHHPSVILLDDGFQHWALERDVDLVLIDSFDPLARNAVFPLGRLREPLTALQRASAFVVTRASPPVPWTGLEALLHSAQPAAPVSYCSVLPVEWVDAETGQTHPFSDIRNERTAAFCGLGNPASFWASLHELGIRPEMRWALSDHHQYRPHQVRRMARQAQVAGVQLLLTTEKDSVNLPAEFPELAAPLRIWWLRMEVAMDREPEFLGWLLYNLGIAR